MRVACERLVTRDEVLAHAVIDLDDAGRVVSIERDRPGARADRTLALAIPGLANTHSHAFHRLLRGRTHAGGGDFWRWRDTMYRVAESLDPDRMRAVATAVYSEMVAAGYTAVGEFHYLHHGPGGLPYAGHAMEVALADAAEAAGIRLTLLDTVYLRAGFGRAPEGAQIRYSDGTAERWLERWHSVRDALATSHPEVTVGAAIHSVRAVAPDDLGLAVGGLPADVPLHVHLSEQPAENADCVGATGMTPTVLLDLSGALSPRTTVVHATHLTDADVSRLGAARVSVSMCPTTEADLGDGLGHSEELHAAGARLTVGSDQNVVIDPFDELRRLEGGARLASGRRGVLPTPVLWDAATTAGHASLRPDDPTGIRPGDQLDLLAIAPRSPRLAGARPQELLTTAAADDVTASIVRGSYQESSALRERAWDAFEEASHAR
ncbi:formimidoylglutamate deiminase [Demequina mangrovi]|uniref:Formiminoglutamate deiminase n=1 Tax=Demequina mangrovi TaxID=1043493 RepID=A0A1H6XFM8_9MICO|nr:formimidoylglutamate deiminase [Demequina mangrovi]SEJ23375.1 formiminoglutamate deiminase [Demequina mangrovi]